MAGSGGGGARRSRLRKRREQIVAKNNALYGKELGANHTRIDDVLQDRSLSITEKGDRVHALGGSSFSKGIRSGLASLNPAKRKASRDAVKKVKSKQRAKSNSRRPTNKAPRRRKK